MGFGVRDQILANIGGRAHFVVLLTPSAVDRCNEPGDLFRCEIEEALLSKRNIVPVMLEGVDFRDREMCMRLEGSGLGKLKDYQAIRINGGDDFFFKLDDLRQRFLTARAGSLLQPLSEVAGEAALKEKIAARDQPEVGLEQLTAQEYFERAFPRTDDWPERIRLFGEAIRCDPSFAEA